MVKNYNLSIFSIKERNEEGGTVFEIISADHTKLSAMAAGFDKHEGKKRKGKVIPTNK